MTRITLGGAVLRGTASIALMASLMSASARAEPPVDLSKWSPEYVRSIVYILYDEGFHFFRMGTASAAAWILFIIILIITIVQLRVQKRWVHYL